MLQHKRQQPAKLTHSTTTTPMITSSSCSGSGSCKQPAGSGNLCSCTTYGCCQAAAAAAGGPSTALKLRIAYTQLHAQTPAPPPPRFVDDGEMKTKYKVIIGGQNFGCGSSREHAPVALGAAGEDCTTQHYTARR